MFKLIFFSITALIIAICFSWLIENNGMIAINWLGYEVQTDILTAIAILFFTTIAIFIFINIFHSIISFKFKLPRFFKKDVLKEKDKIIKKYQKAVQLLVDVSLALNASDLPRAIKLEKEINDLIDDKNLRKLLEAQIIYLKGNYSQASKLFAEFDNKNAHNLALKSQLELALDNKKEGQAIQFAQEIISNEHRDEKTIQTLLKLYKKRGDWVKAEELVRKYDLYKDDPWRLAFINTALAQYLYRNKDYAKAIKHAKIALKLEDSFLAASIILIKSFIKKGKKFRALCHIKSIWKTQPSLLLAELYNFIYKKASNAKRLRKIKKLHKINSNHFISDLAVADLALKIDELDEVRNYLKDSLLKRRTAKAYNMLSLLERIDGDLEKEKSYAKKAKAEKFGQYWFCGHCNHKTTIWNANCINCGSHGNMIWEE
ncbi:MAG: hypothetical protein O3B09_01945 [Proteobacteria bacterium]|nr:hypothetical protein [Pseudomonadota bacterium]